MFVTWLLKKIVMSRSRDVWENVQVNFRDVYFRDVY